MRQGRKKKAERRKVRGENRSQVVKASQTGLSAGTGERPIGSWSVVPMHVRWCNYGPYLPSPCFQVVASLRLLKFPSYNHGPESLAAPLGGSL
jgi:hypothetical protein